MNALQTLPGFQRHADLCAPFAGVPVFEVEIKRALVVLGDV